MQGYIKLHRQILENEFFTKEKYTKGQAWVALLLLTNYKKGYITVKSGEIIKVDRGQCGFSMVALADKFHWDRRTVKRFLEFLECQKMVQLKIVSNHAIITILNYEKYQECTTNGTTECTTNGTTNGTTECTQTRIDKNDKNDKNIKNNITPLPPLGEIDILLQKITNDLPLINRDKWKGLVQEWLSYKREKKQTYRSERSLRAFIKNLRNLSNDEFLKAEQIINRSIGNNWSGIFALNDSTKKESEVLGECWGLT